MRRVLVPLDGSDVAEIALQAIEPLGACEVRLLHVREEADLPLRDSFMENAVAALRGRGIDAMRVLRIGDAAEQILDYARTAGVDLIAMSTHGRTGFTRALLGSVTEAVLRGADVPLLVCREGALSRAWKSVVVALDGSARAEEILPDAFAVARDAGSTLHMMKSTMPIAVPAMAGDVPLYYDPPDPMPYLRAACERAAAERVAARPVTGLGIAGEEIVRCARDLNAGLICMTTHGRTGWRRALRGSVAEHVLRHAPCPVLVRRSVEVSAPVPHDVRPA